MRDDPVPLATKAAELMARAARELQPDDELRELLAELAQALPALQDDDTRATQDLVWHPGTKLGTKAKA